MDDLDRTTVLGKAVLVLQAFTADDHGVSFADLRARTGLPKATLHRTLASLVGVRLLDRAPDGYHLSRQVFELGMRAAVERTLLEVATPFLEDVYEATHETVHLAVREGSEVVYVAKLGGHRQATSPSRIGGRMPLHATAVGKALLAHADEDTKVAVLTGPLARRTPRTITAPGRLRAQLDRVLTEGVAYEFEESAVGLNCVAAAVLDGHERAVAAVSVTGPVTRFHAPRHATVVRAAAAGISAVLARR